MVSYRDYTQEKLFSWFEKAPDWQKDMFCAIWNGANNQEDLVKRAIKLIDQEYLLQEHHLTLNTIFPDNIDFTESKEKPIILKSVSDVQGVGALAARAPLEFGNGLTVVYGENGCGKSSYVRILKAAENPECAGTVVDNIFASKNTSAIATITFSFDEEERSLQWNKANTDKYPVLIYDTDIAHQFVDKENEVVYEPKVLSIISKMANIFAVLLKHYQDVSEGTSNKYTQKPENVEDHPLVQEFARLAKIRDAGAFEKRTIWNDLKETELAAIAKSIQVSEPEKAAQILEAQEKVIQTHEQNIFSLLPLVCDESCTNYLAKRQKQIDTKKVADELTCTCKSKSILDAFGCNSWRNMWAAAVDYVTTSEKMPVEFPMSKEGRCALCQQPLEMEAKSRLQSFNEYVVSKAITDAETAYRDFESVVKELQKKIENVINISEIETALLSGSIAEDIRNQILGFYGAILDRCRWLLNYNFGTENQPPAISLQESIAKEFKKIITELDMQVTALKNTARDRAEQIGYHQELLAIQWTCKNIATKKQLIILDTIQCRCKTNSLTTLKKDLSDILITDAYINRFSDEMLALDPSKRIKVELTSAGAKRGRSYHQISLRGAQSLNKMKAGEVLSEGEYRVVSLAAFLADLSSWGKLMPFIFDDPITSLDRIFEERVARRLIQLSIERQVIVFTHRLAFAQFLDTSVNMYNADATKCGQVSRAQVKHIELRTAPLGQPSEASYIESISLTKKLNNMINSDISSIRKAQENDDYVTADSLMRSLCTQFRNLVERGIEQNLLSGVVLRFNRNISTLKLPRLNAIAQEDISIFDRLMTKYSAFDHSQSIETPISLPEIADVETDLRMLSEWSTDFKKRCDKEEEVAKGKR